MQRSARTRGAAAADGEDGDAGSDAASSVTFRMRRGQRGGPLLDSPYDTLSIKAVFGVGCLLLLVALVLSLVLTINLVHPVPALLRSAQHAPLISLWLLILCIGVVLPTLFLLDAPQHALAARIHVFNAVAVLLLFLLTCAVPALRSALPAALFTLPCFLWAASARALAERVRRKHEAEQPPTAFHQSAAAEGEAQETTPLLAALQAQGPARAPSSSSSSRFVRLLALAATLLVTLILVLLLFDTALGAADSRFRPSADFGQRVPITLRDGTRFHLHVKCEYASFNPSSSAAQAAPAPGPGRENGTHPTALVWTERGVAGSVGAQWLREMVRNAKDDKGRDGDDGHLSLHSVCFFDRVGYGFSDFVEGASSDVALHTAALAQALEALDVAQGPFLVVGTGYGALFARHFAATHAARVHSLLLVDAETPASWYTRAVDARSGLRAGYQAPGHKSIGLFWNDVLPALLSPLGLTRFLGLFAGNGPADRLLAPAGRGGSAALAGGGFRVLSAGGATQALLTASLRERLDANRGTRSRSYRALVKLEEDGSSSNSSNTTTAGGELAKKRTAVLTSFWKLHLDQAGWGAEQKEAIVKRAIDAGALVGWWRVGTRLEPAAGGDVGGPQGLCDTEMGKVFCKEAVRKLLA